MLQLLVRRVLSLGNPVYERKSSIRGSDLASKRCTLGSIRLLGLPGIRMAMARRQHGYSTMGPGVGAQPSWTGLATTRPFKFDRVGWSSVSLVDLVVSLHCCPAPLLLIVSSHCWWGTICYCPLKSKSGGGRTLKFFTAIL